ncbi:TetR/AcrR family transcriptional regulator [Sphingomonas sp. CJ20]
MSSRKFLFADPAKPAVADNLRTRERIEAAVVAVLGDNEKLTHDRVAERAGISRRTVYRYFPDQPTLRQAVANPMRDAAATPESLAALVDEMPARFAAFDAKAAAMTVALASAEGRALRNAAKRERAAACRQALDAPTRALPEPDRTLAIATLQYLSSALAWREMRDQWDLKGADIGTACRWATEVLLADLRKRGDKPLADGPA